MVLEYLTGRQRFLVQNALEHKWTRGAELGVCDGRTLIPLLTHCQDLTMIAVDVWRPLSMNTLDWDHGKNESIFLERAAAFGDRVIIHKGLTWDIAFKVEDDSLDFILIDADHATAAVRLDIKLWSPKVKAGGWIIGHDIDWESVQWAVEDLCPDYETEVDNIWFVRK